MYINNDYYDELRSQESKSNRKTINGFLWFYAAVFLTWILTLIEVFIISKRMMTFCFAVTSLTMIAPIYIRLKKDLSQAWIKYVMLSMLCINCGIITSVLSIHAVLISPIPLLFACQYRNKLTIWYTFFVCAVIMSLSCFLGYYFGICDLNLFFVSSGTRQFYMSLVTENGVNIPLNTDMVFVISVYQILPRVAILLIYTIMLRFSVMSNYDDAKRIVQLTKSKDTDGRTGLYNKRKFEEMADDYYLTAGNVEVAFFDLNNLKKVNDKFGHEEGDRLIETFAQLLEDEQNHRCNAFRFGGDEFMMILDHAVYGELKAVVDNIREKMNAADKIGGEKLSAAVGIAFGEGNQVRELVKEADEKMYDNKKEMKAKR